MPAEGRFRSTTGESMCELEDNRLVKRVNILTDAIIFCSNEKWRWLILRIWRLPVSFLNRQHLLGEHVELHVLVNTIINKRKSRTNIGWVNHPETKRYENHLGMLYDRHEQQVEEMTKRGYNHNSPLPPVKYNPENFTYLDEDYQKDITILASRQEIKEW